jgi:hypothetical protein
MKNKDKNIKDQIKNERVLVYVRIRPFSEDEKLKDNTSPIDQIDTTNNLMIGKKYIYNIYNKIKKNSKKGIRQKKKIWL